MATLPASADHVVLVGMMGSGKTAVGERVADCLGRPFLDLDAWIEDEEGMSISSIFESRGEAAFREMEANVLPSFLANPFASVVSIGGGAVVNEHIRELLGRTHVVWLRANEDTLAERVGDGRARPLLAGKDVVAELDRLSGERAPLYAEVADAIVDVDGLSLDDVVSRVLEAIA